MQPAAKILLAAIIAVEGLSEESKKVIESGYAGLWEFVRPKILNSLIKKMLVLERAEAGETVKKILEEEDVRSFKPVDVVEIIADWVNKIVKK